MAPPCLCGRDEPGRDAECQHIDVLRTGVADPQSAAAGRRVLRPGDDHPPGERSSLLRSSDPGDLRIPAGWYVDYQRREVSNQLRQAAAEYAFPSATYSVVRSSDGVLPLPAHCAGLLHLSCDLLDACLVAEDVSVPVLSCHDDRLRHGFGGLLCGTPGLLPRHVELPAVLRADLDVSVTDLVGSRACHRPVL